MKITIRTFWWAVIASIGATILFCLPGEDFPQEDWFEIVSLDKLIHVGLFAGLTGLWCLPLIHRIEEIAKLRNRFMLIALGFVFYGVIIEFIQGNFIPHRSFGIDDMVADAIGCGIGFMFSNWQLNKQKV